MRIVVVKKPGRRVRKVGHLDVRVEPLRTDESRRIWLTGLEFAQHLLFRISTMRRVTPNFPAPSQLLGWIEVDAHTEGITHLLPVETEQPLDNEKGTWNDILWRPKVTQSVVVVRFQNRFSGTQQLQMLRHHIEVVTCWVQGCNAQLLTLLPVIPVIVVRAEHRHTFSAQNLGDALTQCRLPTSAVSHYSQDDRATALLGRRH